MSLSSWDDYPVHQAAEFIRHVATSDRNFYDRYYFNLHGSSDEVFAIFGLGQYPNLGVTDGFIAVTAGEHQHIVRASAELGDRMDTSVGPLRVEVIEPLRKLRFVVEPTEHQVAMDVIWEGAMPAHEEPRQYLRSRGKVVFDTQRFAQTGCWTGTLTAGDTTFDVTPDRFWGSRDRSWGVRPVGEPEPDGIRQGVGSMAGMWNYFPMQFDDHSILYICQEESGGHRTLEEGVRVWHEPDREIDWLGHPQWQHQTVSGTRLTDHSIITFPETETVIDCTPLMRNFISVGTGYGIDDDWRHGMYQGGLVVQGLDWPSEQVAGLGQYGVVDAVGRFEYEGRVGHGLYETGFFGPFEQLGLTDRGDTFA